MLTRYSGYGSAMVPTSDGDFVKYEDVEKLLRERDELRATVIKFMTVADDVPLDQYGDMPVKQPTVGNFLLDGEAVAALVRSARI